MNVLMKRISQDADLENPGTVSNFLVLQVQETGKEFRVRVSQETVVDLLREFKAAKEGFQGAPSKPAEPTEPDEPFSPPDGEGGTVFGGDDTPLPDPMDGEEDFDSPEDEDSVPSV